ncbi:hypothetical protein [Streptosporangium sandarakinum]|uniref:hypothetical protein n=1 Tax=Streptosporangium sandarakinum TaxID=1260955 RepID=UPI0033AECDA6
MTGAAPANPAGTAPSQTPNRQAASGPATAAAPDPAAAPPATPDHPAARVSYRLTYAAPATPAATPDPAAPASAAAPDPAAAPGTAPDPGDASRLAGTALDEVLKIVAPDAMLLRNGDLRLTGPSGEIVHLSADFLGGVRGRLTLRAADRATPERLRAEAAAWLGAGIADVEGRNHTEGAVAALHRLTEAKPETNDAAVRVTLELMVDTAGQWDPARLGDGERRLMRDAADHLRNPADSYADLRSGTQARTAEEIARLAEALAPDPAASNAAGPSTGANPATSPELSELSGRVRELGESLAGAKTGLEERVKSHRDASRQAGKNIAEKLKEAEKAKKERDRGARKRHRDALAEVRVERDTGARHKRVAVRYQEARVRAEKARAAVAEASRALDALAAEEPAGRTAQRVAEVARLAREAADAVAAYDEAVKEALPPRDAMTGSVPADRLPHMTKLTGVVNRVLADHGVDQTFSPDELEHVLGSRFRRVTSDDGVVLQVGGATRGELRIRLRMGDLAEIVDPKITGSETMIGALPQGGRSVGTSGGRNRGMSFGLNVIALAKTLAGMFLEPHNGVRRFIEDVLDPFFRLEGSHSRSRSRGEGGNASEFALFGGVEDNRGESILLDIADVAWDVEFRPAGKTDWTATETVDARSGSEAEVIASAGDAKRLRVLVSHAYADHAPTETVQQSANHRDPNGRFPEHVVISMSGADERVDRTVELLGGSAVGDVARRQIRTFMAEDLPGRMYEAFNRPRGLSRTITDGGRPLGTVRVRSRIEWVPAPDGAPAPSMEPVGSATNKHHQERLRVQFSGTSGSTSSGRSRSTGVTVGGQGVLPGTSSLGGKAKLKGAFGYTRGRSRSTGANTGGTEIRPGVYRYSGDTQGYVAVVVHEITVHRFGEAEPRPTFVQRARALMRIPLTHAYDYGAEVDANAVARDDSGAPRRNPDGSPVFRDDRKSGPPPGRKAAPSGWQTGDPVRVRGAGPSEVQEFTPIDRAEVEAYLRERGMLAPLDADGNEIPSNDPLEWASHEANARELEEQLDERRVAAAYDQGAQDGIPMTFSRHRTGHASQTVTLVLTIDQHEVDSWEHTDAEVPVDLDIDSETSGLSSSESAGHDIRVEGGRGDTNADEEVAASRGGGYTYSRGLNAGATQGGTVNQVILGENNDLTAVARRKHTVRIADISSMADPITTQQGSSLLMTPAGMLPEDDSGNGPARTPTPHPTSRATLRRATLRAVDAGDLLQRVMPKLPRWVRSHPVIANMLASFLNVRSFMAQPDRLFGRAGMELAVRSRGTRRFRSPVWVSGRAGESEFVTAVDYVSGDINLTLGSQSASAGRTRGHAGDGSLSGGLSQAAPPKGGAGLSGSASRTTGLSAQELGIWGRERLVIETGKHYLFRMSADFDVTVGVPGAANAKVVSAPGRPVVYMVPERDALRLYAQGELRLPLDQVADVMERFLDGNLKIAPDVAAPLVGRYLSEQSAARDSGAPLPVLTADHTAERMVGKLTEAADGRYGGLGHTRNPGRRLARMIAYERARAAVLEKLLDDPDAKLSRRERAVAPEVATLPEHLRDAMGQTGVEELVLKRNGAETELFDEVLAAVEKKAPGALRKNRALWRSLFRDFSGKRWHGKLDSMLDPDGAPHTYTARVRGNDGRPLTVRVKMEFVGPPRLLNRTDEAGVIVQDYTYRDSSWSEAFNIAFGGGVSGEGAPAALKGAVGGDAKVQAGVNHSTSGTAGEQLTGIQRIASFNGMDRVAHAVKVTVEVDRPGRRGRGGRRPVVTELKGRMIRLVPSELVEAAKAAEASASPDTRPLAFPRTFFTESTRAAGLFQAAYDGLSRSDVLGRRGARRYRHDLEHALTAMARNANLRKMAGPNGHRIARFPVPGRPGRVVEVRVRAVPSQVRVLAAGRADVELGDVERFQATSGEAVESGQSLGASGGSGYGPSGVNVHGSAGRSTSERISEGGGNRDETSGFRKGDVTTVRTRIDYHITYELKSVVPGRPFYRRVEMLNAATGRADVTLFEEGMAEARREQEAPPVRGGGWRFGEPAVRHEPGRGWRARWGHGSGRPTTRFSLDELSRQSQSSRDFDPAAPYRSLAEHTLRRAPGIRRSGAPLLLTVDAGPEWQAERVNEARALARELGVPVHLEVREPGGVARPYLATPDGGLLSAALDPSGRRVVGVPDGGFAAALAALPPGLVAAANGRIDLRALHDRLPEGGDFTALVDRELTPPGVPAAPATGAAPHAGSQAQPVGGTYQGSVTSAPGGAPSAGGGSFSVTATQIPGTAFAVDIRAPHLADLTTAEVQTALRQAGPSALGRGVRDHRWSADGSTLIVELRNGDTHHFRVRIGRPRRRLSWDRSAGMPVVHFGPSSRLMARTKLRTGSAEDPSEMVLTSRPDPKMVARMVGHEVGHALQRKAAAEHRSGPAPFRRLLAAVDEITRHDYCMDARYDEYGHLADGWRSARTDDERAYYAHEMNGLRQLMLFEGHVPPVPPWEAGGAGRIGSGLGLDGLLNHSEPRVETRDEYWGRMRRLTNTTGWIPPEECTCPPGEPCVCGRRAQTPRGGTSPSPGSAPSAPPPGAASPSPEAPAPSVPVAADRADGSALAAADRADGSTPVAAGRTDGRTG